MSNDSTQTDQASVVDVAFGADNLVANAKAYKADKRIMDAASTYDSLDDAIAALSAVWAAFEIQEAEGGRYTPSTNLGFGSDNAAVIASKILGRGTTVGTCRKALAKLGS